MCVFLAQAEAELVEKFRQPVASCPEVEEQVEVFRVWVDGVEGQGKVPCYCTFSPGTSPPPKKKKWDISTKIGTLEHLEIV